MNRYQIISGYLAPALLVLITPDAAAFEQGPKDGANMQQRRQADAIDAQSEPILPIRTDLVRLEDSLQWTGRKAVELPVSLSVTDLLPGNC